MEAEAGVEMMEAVILYTAAAVVELVGVEP
jgi:hypothetical protein